MIGTCAAMRAGELAAVEAVGALGRDAGRACRRAPASAKRSPVRRARPGPYSASPSGEWRRSGSRISCRYARGSSRTNPSRASSPPARGARPTAGAPARVSLPEAGHRAGHRRPMPGRCRRSAASRRSRRRARRARSDAGVRSGRSTKKSRRRARASCARCTSEEAAAARAGERALADPRDRGGCDARVDGVAARTQNFGPGLRGQRMPGC